MSEPLELGNKSYRILDECRIIAKSDDYKKKRYFHGACVVSGSRIYGSGYNNSTRVYIRGKSYYSVHAEMMALSMSGLQPLSRKGKCASRRGPYGGIRKRNYDLWVIRLGSKGNGKLMESYPCNLCIQFMREYGIKRVFYSNGEGNVICEVVETMEFRHMPQNWSGN